MAMSFMIESNTGMNPLLTHNASLTLSMCTHGRTHLPAFGFLAHFLLIPIGFRQSCEGLNYHVIQKLVGSQKQSMNRNHLN